MKSADNFLVENPSATLKDYVDYVNNFETDKCKNERLLMEAMRSDFDNYVNKFVAITIPHTNSTRYCYIHTNIFDDIDEVESCDIIEVWDDEKFKSITYTSNGMLYAFEIFNSSYDNFGFNYSYTTPFTVISESEYNNIKNIVMSTDKQLKGIINK